MTSRGRSVRPVSAIGGNDAHDTPADAGEVSAAVSRPQSSLEDDKDAMEKLESAVVVGGDEQSPLSGKGPARGYSWEPFEQGNTAAIRHGANSMRMTEPVAKRIVAELRNTEGLDYLRAPRFTTALWAYARAAAKAELVLAWIDGMTPAQQFTAGRGKDSPSEMLRQLQGRAANMGDRIGLSPLGASAIADDIAAARKTLAKRAERDQLQTDLKESWRQQTYGDES